MLQTNTIYNGDCLEIMAQIDDGSVDFVFTDLPYGTTKAKFDMPLDLAAFWAQVNRIIKPNGCIALWSSQPFTTDLITSNRKMFRYEWVIEKNRSTGFLNAKKQPLKAHEEVVIFYKKSPTYNPQKTTGHPRKVSLVKHQLHCNSRTGDNYGSAGPSNYDSTERYPRSVLKFKWPDRKGNRHPQQKPLDACEYFIRTYTNEGDLVLDCTTGSGTICKAAQNTNRAYIGIEKNADFYKAACEWLKNSEKSGE